MTVNKFVTSFEYLDDQVGKDKNRTLKTDLKYNFTNNHSLLFSRRENKKINLTEYNNIIYEYKNDCLKAGIVYQKKNYTNNDLKPGEELMFTITLGSFGSVNSPNF